jgi:hypothetical protein
MLRSEAANPDWDIFVSHASEDKEAVAIPLRNILSRFGFRIWLDVGELHVGDSLSGKIDEGLANSFFGIVVLSPAFFAKDWPKRELAGLFAVEEAKGKTILPVWHQIDKAGVAKFSPILADRVAVSTAAGLEAVGVAIRRAILAVPTFSEKKRLSTAYLLAEILDHESRTEVIAEFLNLNLGIFVQGFRAVEIICNQTIDGEHFEFAMRSQWVSTEPQWLLVRLLSPKQPSVIDGMVAEPVSAALSQTRKVRSYIAKNPSSARDVFPNISERYHTFIFSGRRAMLTDKDRALSEPLLGRLYEEWIFVRSYDFLLECADEFLARSARQAPSLLADSPLR